MSPMPFNRRWTVAILGGTAIVVGVGFLGVRKAPADTHARNGVPAAVPVAVASVGREDVPVRLSALGSVAAFNTVTVRPRVDGQLMRVLFREGQFVKRGDLLAEIDPRPFQVQLEQAQGQLAKDQAQLANARLDLTRYQTLLQRGLDRAPERRRAGLHGRTARSLAEGGRGGHSQRSPESDVRARHRADRRSRRTAPGRSGQRRQRQQHDRARRDHADGAHRRGVHAAGRSAAHRAAADRGARRAARRRLRSQRQHPPRQRIGGDARQPDRPEHRHGAGQGRLRQPRSRAVPGAVRERAAAGRYPEGADRRARRGRAAGAAGAVRVHDSQRHGQHAAGHRQRHGR